MKNMIKTWRRAAVCLTVTLLMSLAMVSTVAAANKSLKLSNAHFNKAEGSPFGVRGAELCAGFLKNDKLKKSGMKFSADVYIPVSALKKDGGLITLDGYLYLQKTNLGKDAKKDGRREEWNGLLGFAETRYDFYISLKKNGKFELKKHEWDTNKITDAGKYLSVTKKGKYYLFRMKNVPFTGKYYKFLPKKNDYSYVPIATKKTYFLSPSVLLTSDAKKAWSGNIYVDNLKVTSGTRTQTITFNKKDYKDLYVSNWQNTNGQVPEIKKPMG